MIGLNAILDYQVITKRGIKWARQCTYGDKLMEYGTGQFLEYQETVLKELNHVVQIDYNDGRQMVVNEDDIIYLGRGKTTRMNSLLMHATYRKLFIRADLEHPPLHLGRVYRTFQDVDPYVTGAFWFGGDWEDEELNINIHMDEINGVLSHKYHLEYADKLGRDEKVYFRRVNGDDPITWKEFFRQWNWYPCSHRTDADIIPRRYEFGSIQERQQFLMGVFDVGWQHEAEREDEWSDRLEVVHPSEDRLKALQRFMNGLGIITKITRVKPKSEHYVDKYRLSVIDGSFQYPGFFYDTKKIEQMINQDRQINIVPGFKLQISDIHRPSGPLPFDRAVVPCIRTREKNKVICDSNFLPRVTQ